MEFLEVAVLGAGNPRCMPDVIGSFAGFFGERPLSLRLYDADEERLDLFDRLARTLFLFNRSTHALRSTVEPAEALEDAQRVVLCLDENCATKLLRASRRAGFALGDEMGLIEQAVEELLRPVPDEVEVLSLLGPEIEVPLPRFRRAAWPPQAPDQDLATVPHQVLRFLNGEEYPHALLKSNSRSPLARWLEDPASIPALAGRRSD